MTEMTLTPIAQPLNILPNLRQPSVMTDTAGAVALPRPGHRLLSAVRALFVASTADARPEKRRCPPRRETFMEHAAMAREMYRL